MYVDTEAICSLKLALIQCYNITRVGQSKPHTHQSPIREICFTYICVWGVYM